MKRSQSAKFYAAQIRRILHESRTRKWMEDFGRSWDNCFENFNGSEVVRLIVERLAWDEQLRADVLRHKNGGSIPQEWIEAASKPIENEELPLFA